jgi:hypothetical protein
MGNRLQIIDLNTGNFVLKRLGLNGFRVKPLDFAQGLPHSMTQYYNGASYTNLISREQRVGDFKKAKFGPTKFLYSVTCFHIGIRRKY